MTDNEVKLLNDVFCKVNDINAILNIIAVGLGFVAVLLLLHYLTWSKEVVESAMPKAEPVVPKVGDQLVEKTDDPFLPRVTWTIIGVKEGWVRYDGSFLKDFRSPLKSFVKNHKLYKRTAE